MDRDSAPSIGLRAQVLEVCVRAGLGQIEAPLLERMTLLAEGSATLRDNARAMDLSELVFAHYAGTSDPLTETEKTTVRVGSLLSDIGKTGPLSADLSQQRLIVSMFAIERVQDERMPVVQFFRTYFAEQAEVNTECYRSLGLDPNMSLREFWNLHSSWTLDLLQHSAVPREAVAAAAAHHLLEHINPHAIVADDGRFTLPFGSNLRFDRAEKLVILLDKYDAVRRRGQRDHASAISWLGTRISNNLRFGQDAEFHALLAVLDEVFAQGTGHLYQSQ